ncbi:hypothetical protein LP420_01780 [Massilia sp. B-10]|nr:hypothetical protein LP420_01780 [Massilia sp. B-10]
MAAPLRHAVGETMRAENQDNYLLIDASGLARFLKDQQPQEQRIHGWPPGHARVAVLDGMGGHGRGREAAEAVVQGLLAIPPCASLGELAASLDALHTTLQHHFAVDDADDKRPRHHAHPARTAQPAQAALLYHVGDSRLYEVAGGRITPLTVDHVLTPPSTPWLTIWTKANGGTRCTANTAPRFRRLSSLAMRSPIRPN